MNKGDIVSAIANKAGFTLKDADEAYKAFVAAVAEALKEGKDVALAGFGTFKVKVRAARKGINPQTKATIEIPATKAPSFKFGKSFKELLK
ncbi:MAG: HU family DNA-binding protein [Clostridia bacterium]|nr:HU family DNA-binding protein [Clostridia bacterium]